MRIILSLSGGADSSTLLAYLLHRGISVQPVAFQYEQRHKKEIDAARFVTQHYRTKYPFTLLQGLQYFLLTLPHSTSALTNSSIPVPPLESVVGHPQPPTYVPFRNLIFSSFCLSIAEGSGANGIALGVHKSDTYGYWDTTPQFVDNLRKLISLSRGEKSLDVLVPFLQMEKSEIIQWGLSHNVPYEYTWSCYRGGEKPCRECATCREREASFEKCGVVDPLLHRVGNE